MDSFAANQNRTSLFGVDGVGGGFNTTSESHWSALILSIVMMFCCSIGLPGNLISACIFFRLTSRSPINVLLMSLSIIDFCLLLFSAPIMLVPSLNVYLENEWLNRTYPMALVVCYPITLICQESSMYTFVLITLERYLAVCKIFQLRNWCTTSRTKWAQIMVVIFAVMSNLVRFWEYVVDKESPLGYRRLLRDDYVYFTVYHLVLHLITHFIVPFSLIAFFGGNILKTMSRTNTANNHSTGLSRRQASQRKTTSMICVVTAMFIVCNCLPFILNMWEVIDFHLFEGPYGLIAYMLVDVANALVLVNSSITFVFYWVYCQKYRRLLQLGLGRVFGRCGLCLESDRRTRIIRSLSAASNASTSEAAFQNNSNSNSNNNKAMPSSCSRLLTTTTTTNTTSSRSSIAATSGAGGNRSMQRRRSRDSSSYVLVSRASIDLNILRT